MRELSSGVRGCFGYPHDARPSLAMLLTAYLDETGQEGLENVIVAGFIGNEIQWAKFEPEWREGLGKKQKLHLSDLRFKRERDKTLLKRLGPIPSNCGLKAIYGCIRASDYVDLVRGKPGNLERGTNAYVLCFMPIFDSISKMFAASDKIRIVCEAQDRYAGYIHIAFDNFTRIIHRNLHRPYFDGISFIQKDESIFLQPADYLCFALANKLKDKHSVKAKWCAPILENKLYGRTLSRSEVRQAITRTLKTIGLSS
jgi:hypothetical protein